MDSHCGSETVIRSYWKNLLGRHDLHIEWQSSQDWYCYHPVFTYIYVVTRNGLGCGIDLGWGYFTKFLCSVIFQIIHNHQNADYLYSIPFISDRCHCSWVAVTLDKFECDLRYLTYTFAKSKFPIMKKLTKGALVTITPGLGFVFCVLRRLDYDISIFSEMLTINTSPVIGDMRILWDVITCPCPRYLLLAPISSYMECLLWVQMRAHFCYKAVHCGMYVWCIVGFARLVHHNIYISL